MHPFKQALNQYKNHLPAALVLGCISFFFAATTSYIPAVGSFVLSLSLLVMQLVTRFYLKNNKWPKFPDLFPQTLLPLLICALVMTPTSILIGSAHGLMDSPQEFGSSAFLSVSLLFLGTFFYTLISHALMLTQDSSLGIAKALDRAGIDTLSRFRLFGPTCLLFAFLFLLAQLTWGIAWIVVLPLFYFTMYNSSPKTA